MRRAFLSLAAAAFLSIAAPAFAIDLQSGDEVTVTGEHDDMVFAAGGELDLALTATDDVFAAGGEITVREGTYDGLNLAGGEITVSGGTVRDLTAAGGQLLFTSGEVTDDFIAAGGEIDLLPELTVTGSAVISGGDLNIQAPIGGDLALAGGRVELNSAVGGNVVIDGGEVIIGPDARIAGSLTHRAGDIRIAPEAQITGAVTALEPHPKPDPEDFAKAAATFAIFGLASLVILAGVVALSLPRLMNSAAAMMRAKPFTSIGVGLLITAAFPLFFAVLLATLVGWPLALMMAFSFALLWLLALAGAAYALGMILRDLAHRGGGDEPAAGGRLLWATVAMLILAVLGAVPVVGGFVWTAAFLFGLGAVATNAARLLALKPSPA